MWGPAVHSNSPWTSGPPLLAVSFMSHFAFRYEDLCSNANCIFFFPLKYKLTHATCWVGNHCLTLTLFKYCFHLFRSPVKLRLPCSIGRCSRSFVASLIWPVTPQSPLLSVPWKLPSSAVPAPLSCSPRPAGEKKVHLFIFSCSSTAMKLEHYNISLSLRLHSLLRTSPWLIGSVPTFMALAICALPVTFWGLNLDILQVNFITLLIPPYLRVHPRNTWHRGCTTISEWTQYTHWTEKEWWFPQQLEETKNWTELLWCWEFLFRLVL